MGTFEQKLHQIRSNPKQQALLAGLLFGLMGLAYLVLAQAATAGGPIVGIGSKCIDNYSNLKSENNRIQLYSCNKSKAQVWNVKEDRTIVNANGYCLTAKARTLKTLVTLNKCVKKDNQKWIVNSLNNTIVNVASGLCIDSKGASAKNKNTIWMYKCNGSVAQVWKPTTSTVKPPSITTFTAEPISVKGGRASKLRWSSEDTTTCRVSPGGPANTVATSWTTPILTPGKRVFTLTCKNSVGATVSKKVSINVKPADKALLKSDFNNLTPSTVMPLASFQAAMGDPKSKTGLTNTSIVGVSGRGNVIRQTIPPNTSGGGSGITAIPHLSREVDEASIQYDIRFSADFDWGWGGKLPGLGGALPGVKPSIAAGCNSPTGNAWSGRGMWITPGSYGSVTGANEFVGYMYTPGKKDSCGDNQRTTKSFKKGTWHTIKQYYKLNTISAKGTPNADGIHRIWLDGKLVKESTAFKYRNSPKLHINYLYWHIFRGGSTPQWSSPTSGVIDIDNLKITSP